MSMTRRASRWRRRSSQGSSSTSRSRGGKHDSSRQCSYAVGSSATCSTNGSRMCPRGTTAPRSSISPPRGATRRRRALLDLTAEELDALPPDAEVLDQLAHVQRLAEADALSWLLVGLVRTSPMVSNNSLRELYWNRPASVAELAVAVEAIADFDEERVLLESAVKGSDGFFTTFFVSPYSKYIARWAGWRGMSPNTVTVFSMALGIVAAVAFA